MVSSSSNPNPLLQVNLFSRFFHSWLSSLINKSHKQGTLHLDDLYDLPDHLESTISIDKLEANWFDEIKRCPQNPSLVRATLRTAGWRYMLLSLLLIPLVLRLSTDAMNKFSSGEITNLLANDANKVELLHYYLNYLWIAPLQTLAVIFILWSYVKYITFIIIGYTLFLLFIQPLFSRLFLYLRAEVLKVTDERVKIMSEIIRSMRIIKMYCWESAFERKVCRIRTREMIKTTVFMMCHCIETILSQSYLSVIFLMIYGTMWSLNIKFDTRSFTLLYVLVNYTRQSCITYFNFAIRDVLNYMAAQKRIRAFLLFDESERDNRLLSTSFQDVLEIDKIDENSSKRPCQVICDLQEAQWEKNGKFSLKSIKFDAYPGDLICIIGSVGSGKSSLLQTLTGEITHFDGKVRLHGSFCYVPQESWIFSSTVKNNILFGKEYNSKLFQRVVRATALDADLVQLTHGPNTLVGDQGVMLSGGQKARVNMARALYRNADIYLLDDPLSAVDAKVSKHLFEKSIKNYLRDKICILVTHQIQFLQDATKIIVLDNGEMVQMGTYEELLVSSPSFSQLLEDINQHKQEEPVVSLVNQRSMIGSIHSEKENVEDEDMNSSSRNVETKQEGIVKWNVYLSYLRAGVGAILGVILILIIFSTQQTVAIYSNWWLVAWSNEENRRHQNVTHCMSTQDNKTDKIRGFNDTEWNTHRNQRFYVFSVLVSILCFLILIRAVVCRLICLNAVRVLHNQMFKRIIRCPISFFDMNPVGRILNRFTSDVAAADDSLPMTVFECLSCLSQVLGAIILVGLLNPWSFIPAEPNSLLTLHHVSLIIEPSEKIGIVGRTGAGKSSFIQTLFRMGTIVDGRILIDNIDIATLGLDDVRRRISIIPQDPVLFTGTMRSNLDPFGIYSDLEIWNALEQVQLKTLVADIMSNGLHSLVSESGSNLSVGQKQLVCLARAILKKSKILVIDEATANVDNATDELIQKAIRDKFKECTVLTVAHRLRSVIDSDRIMVLSDGKMVEFDAPEMLLSNKYSYFCSLVEQTGVAEAEYLRTLANSNELHKNKKQKTFESDDETMLETNETDPLVPSAKLLI
ncbi:unnamed protein product [Rotaria magnacalcarata]|uniref:Uncharacterized protein n=1 Tax=Rotaria magnacalcarata TaxID=392030 RepID=A0A816FQK9_9BILA|nr:unnamed protein product [Rotaria magnacalcarata]